MKFILSLATIVVILISSYTFLGNTAEKNLTNNNELEKIERKNMVELEDSITSDSLEKLISKGLKTFYTRNSDSINVTETIIEDQDVFVSFTLEQNDYTGFLYAKLIEDTYTLEDFFLNRNLNQTDKVVINQSMGSLTGEVSRNYKIIGGNINDTSIDAIHIFYPNADYIILKLDDTQKTFMHVNKGYTESPQKIIGYNGDKEIYNWENEE